MTEITFNEKFTEKRIYYSRKIRKFINSLGPYLNPYRIMPTINTLVKELQNAHKGDLAKTLLNTFNPTPEKNCKLTYKNIVTNKSI